MRINALFEAIDQTSNTRHSPRDINDMIDDEIQNIQYGGNLPKNLYSNVIADVARQAARNPNPTTREKST